MCNDLSYFVKILNYILTLSYVLEDYMVEIGWNLTQKSESMLGSCFWCMDGLPTGNLELTNVGLS